MNQFTALNGPELLEVILDKIKTKLLETGAFSQNLAYPWIKLTIPEIKILAYPAQGMDEESKIKSDKIEEILSEKDAPQPDSQPMIIDLEATIDIIDTPDKARDEAGLPVPTPGMADVAGVKVPHIVDKLVFPLRETKAKPRV